MDHVGFSDVDSTAEIANQFNKVVDNMNRIEAMVLGLIAKKKPTKKKPTKKKVAEKVAAKKGGKDV